MEPPPPRGFQAGAVGQKMPGVAVFAVESVGDHRVGSVCRENLSDFRHDFFRRGRKGEKFAVRSDVRIAEGKKLDGGAAQRAGGATLFGFAYRAELRPRAQRRLPRLAALAARAAHHAHVRPARREQRQRAAGKDRFIVGMGDQAEKLHGMDIR